MVLTYPGWRPFCLAKSSKAFSFCYFSDSMFTKISRIARRFRSVFSVTTVFSFGAALGYSTDSIATLLPENYLPQLSPILNAAMTDSDAMRIRELSEELSLGTKTRMAAPSQFRARGSASYRKERDVSGADEFGDRLFYNFVLTKSIYHWGEVKALRRRGEIANEIERLISFGSYRSLALDIRSAYMELIARDLEVKVAESDLTLKEDLLEKEGTAVEGGIASGDKLTLAQDQRDRSELAVLEAKSAYEQQLLALSILTGVSEELIRKSVPETIPRVGVLDEDTIKQLTASVEDALITSSNLKRLEQKVEDAEEEVAIFESKLKPKLNFESGLTQFDLDDRGVRREEELIYAGVSISWSIWDGAESRGFAREARSRRELARIQIDQAKRSLEADLQNARRAIEIAKLNLSIEEQFLERGEGILASVKQKYEENTMSKQGFEGAQRGVRKQEAKTIRARANYLNAVAQLASLLGLDPAAMKYIASREA